MSRTTAVLLMAYGTPRHPEEIEAYYTDIRRGRPPTPEALADLVARYDAIGGISPLAQLTEAQRDALQAALDERAPDTYRVDLGLKHADPKIEEATEALLADGVERIVGLVLAPHYSSYSIGQYLGRARAVAEPAGVPVGGVDSWATEPAFIDFISADLERRLEAVPTGSRVLFTAHSLPQRIIDGGDPYPDELLADAGSVPGVVVSAVGFVADHLEVLYDLDIEAANRAAARGLAFARTACVNDDAAVMGALADRVISVG